MIDTSFLRGKTAMRPRENPPFLKILLEFLGILWCVFLFIVLPFGSLWYWNVHLVLPLLKNEEIAFGVVMVPFLSMLSVLPFGIYCFLFSLEKVLDLVGSSMIFFFDPPFLRKDVGSTERELGDS